MLRRILRALKTLVVQYGCPLADQTSGSSSVEHLSASETSPLLAPRTDPDPCQEAPQVSLLPTGGHAPLPTPTMAVPSISRTRSASPVWPHRSSNSEQEEAISSPTSNSSLSYSPSSPDLLHDPSLSALPSTEVQNEPPSHTSQARARPQFAQASPPPPHVQGRGPTYFPNANRFAVREQNFHNVQNFAPSKTVFEHLQPYVSHGAAHNSAEECDAPRCSHETRKAIQEEVVGLLRDGDRSQPSKKLIWLGGPAGAGKTAIMGTVAEKCQKTGILAGSFFFSSSSGSTDRRRNYRFASTLAFQLQQHVALRGSAGERILSVVEDDPAIFTKRLQTQVDALFIGPWQDGHLVPSAAAPLVIIVDGLDECDGGSTIGENGVTGPPAPARTRQEEQLEVLDSLLKMVNDPAFPFRIVIASRPESWIRAFFETSAQRIRPKYSWTTSTVRKKILRCSSNRSSQKLDAGSPNPPAWPGEEVVAKLVDDSSGQFIYAATVIRFIETPSDTPQVQLNIVLNLHVPKVSHPLEALDTLYTRILLSVPKPDLTFKWLKAYQILESIIPSGSLRFFHYICESSAGEAQLTLGALPSLIHAPPVPGFNDGSRSRSSAGENPRTSDFLWEFFGFSHNYMMVARYSGVLAEDILVQCDPEWWMSVAARYRGGPLFQQDMFIMVHKNCWFCAPCRPVCKLWRQEILPRIQGQRRAPTWSPLKLQLDRFGVMRLQPQYIPMH
ncbi:hypothetical protein NMY22_g7036 [Coprinellus aureogranulatus]|nr:hypothetical protein NMY22_g7036 [Coprinellus aureogranulatus]